MPRVWRYNARMSDEQPDVTLLSEHVRALLESRGVTPTPQRLEVGAILFTGPRHLSADQILAELRAVGSRVSKATVYNTLKLFHERALVREVHLDPSRVYYDPTTEPHHHFYNLDSGELSDISSDSVMFEKLPDAPPGTEHDSVEVIVRIRNQTG